MSTTTARRALPPAAAPTPAAALERKSRMSMKNARTDVPKTGLRVLVYGPDGVGKTTFGAQSPKPIFLCAENGLVAELVEQYQLARAPSPSSFDDVLEFAWNFANEEHEYQSLVIDTLDWLEALLFQSLCVKHSKQSIEEVGGGWQKGYVAAIEEWRKLLIPLTRAWESGRNVIALAHSQIREFKNPTGTDFDRWGLKLWNGRNSDASALWREWADDVLFLNFEYLAGKHPDEKRAKGIQQEQVRVLNTEWNVAWDAKSRHNLPARLPVSWADYVGAVAANRPVDPDAMIASIREMMPALPAERQALLEESLKIVGTNATALRMLRERVTAEVERS